jgi:ABC-type multidrug transport system fused ATPase/permease subunit
LNTDTNRLASDSFDVPADFITKITFTISTLVLIGRHSARLALIGSATLPFVAAMQFAVIEFYQRIEKKKSSYREMTAASTSETIQEIRTVREVSVCTEGCSGDESMCTEGCSGDESMCTGGCSGDESCVL